jgi:hypothetical protein
MMATITQTENGEWAVEFDHGTMVFNDQKMAEAFASAVSKTPAESAQILDDLYDGLDQ